MEDVRSILIECINKIQTDFNYVHPLIVDDYVDWFLKPKDIVNHKKEINEQPKIMKKCKVCGDRTNSIFNINFKATPICESCAKRIFLQQAVWYTQQNFDDNNKIKSK